MTTTVDAIYENGRFVLSSPLPLPEHTPVRITIDHEPATAGDPERAAWLKLSETSLQKVWDNSEDDAFNELLTK